MENPAANPLHPGRQISYICCSNREALSQRHRGRKLPEWAEKSGRPTTFVEINASALGVGEEFLGVTPAPGIAPKPIFEESQGMEQLTPISAALDSILELGRAGELVRRIDRLTALLEDFGPKSGASSEDCPKEARPGIARVAALLAVASTKAELQELARRFEVDLRDLNETELAHLEKVSIRTVREWRTNGTGPAYRNEAGIRYPLLWLWEWRQKGRQTLTSQKTTRGRRRD